MTTLQEKALRFNFPGVIRAWHFDNERIKGNWCAVDFVVETDSHFFLIEVKGPLDDDFTNRKELEKNLFKKFRDTLMHLGIDGEMSDKDKPIRYLILIDVTNAHLNWMRNLSKNLKRPKWLGPDRGKSWKRSFGVAVVNFDQWNAQMPQMFPHWKVRRV